MGHGYLLNHSHVYHTIFIFLCKHFFVIFFTVIFKYKIALFTGVCIEKYIKLFIIIYMAHPIIQY